MSKLWIARDVAKNDDQLGSLHIFYDMPLWDYNEYKFVCSRCIGELPKYMYPEINDGEVYEFENLIKIKRMDV